MLVLWAFWSVNEKVVAPNVISQQPSSEKADEPLLTTDSAKNTDYHLSEDGGSVNKIQSQQADKTFSYMQLYRDFRFLNTCNLGKVDYQSAQSIAQAKQTRLDQFVESGRQVNIEVTATHLNHYEAHLDRCIPMLEKYHDINMAKELLTAPTATKKEEQLKRLRNLIQSWDEAWQHVFNVAKGYDNPEAQSLLNQIAELDQRFNQQYGHIEVQFTQEESRAHYQNIQPLYAQLEQAIKISSESKDEAWQQVQLLKNKLESYMQLQDADLFFEASALLNDDRQLRTLNANVHPLHFKRENLNKFAIPYKKVGEDIKSIIQPMNRLNFAAIAPYANQLYLCATGEDCAPGSTLMSHYCLQPQYPSACEKDLMAFFADDYLSPNQLEDVMNLFDQLVVIYAP